MDARLLGWIEEIRRFNPRLHLVSRSMEDRLEEQAAGTLSLMEAVEEPQIADLGSGSGMLAVPYRVANPGSRICLIERSEKKALFLRHVIDTLGLTGMELVDFDPRERSAGPFPAVMSRAFSPLSSLPEAVMSVIERPGRFYYFSTGEPGAVSHPLFVLKNLFSRQCRAYRLNLEVYEVTSR